MWFQQNEVQMKSLHTDIQSYLRPHVPRAPIARKAAVHHSYSGPSVAAASQVHETNIPFTKSASGAEVVFALPAIAPMLAPQVTQAEFLLSNHQKAKLVAQGIQKVSFENFKKVASLDYTQMAWLLDCARNTLINKKGTDTLDATLSEKLIGLAEVYTRGIDVFGSLEAMQQWLHHTNMALGGITPFSLLQSSYGRAEVLDCLGRIEWGVFA